MVLWWCISELKRQLPKVVINIERVEGVERFWVCMLLPVLMSEM